MPYSTTEVEGRLVCHDTVALDVVTPLTATPLMAGAGLLAVAGAVAGTATALVLAAGAAAVVVVV